MVRLEVTSLFVALSMVLCLVPGNSIATEVSQPNQVSGEATLTLQNIGQSQTIFATWELEIQIPNMIGVDFLPDKDMGLRYQVDAHLGDGDGFISSSESTQFHSSLKTGLGRMESWAVAAPSILHHSSRLATSNSLLLKSESARYSWTIRGDGQRGRTSRGQAMVGKYDCWTYRELGLSWRKYL